MESLIRNRVVFIRIKFLVGDLEEYDRRTEVSSAAKETT